MLHKLEKYRPISDAIAVLFQPSAEVVIHSTEVDRVFHISNPISGRKSGDPSPLHFMKLAQQRGFQVNIFTVNEVSEMKRWSETGVDGIFTDFYKMP
ncbi:MAG: hypothetical protein GY799_23485 [Desulfobulbaceae bacterium]|nr:hypothetical protein [Desulfobulbaceae bacterium]